MVMARSAPTEFPWLVSAAEAGDLEREAAGTLHRSSEALLRLQDPAGWWKGDLETNVAIEAEDLLLRTFLGICDDETLRLTANWIRSKQCADGGWSSHYGGPSDLALAVEAYTALRIAGDSPDADHMRLASEFVRDMGGVECARVFTRVWLALFGLWSWRDLPAMPPEMILLPRWVPLNIYDFACWARQTIVPLTIVGTYRPQVEQDFTLDELRTGVVPPERRPRPMRTPTGCFQRLDRVLHRFHHRAPWRLRETSMKLAEQWIIRRQESDGCWGGIQPPWVYSIIALHLRGYSLDHPILAKALACFDSYEVREGDMRWMECCQSPVWDTALAVVALGDAGLRRDDPAMVAAADWMLDEEVRVRGDWAARRPELAPGGWAFEFQNDNYPDLDDTAEVVLALGHAQASDPERANAAIARAVAWAEGMQSSDGGYAAFDADNVRRLCEQLPFCDFGEVIDPPSVDVTAHVVEMLCWVRAHTDIEVDARRLRRAVDWMWLDQETDGSWFGRWGVNHLYGLGAVLPALRAVGVPPSDRRIRRAVRWLHATQGSEGGWGEDLRSYESDSWRGRGDPTASQTAWALLALMAADEFGERTRRGVEWLARTCGADGTWDEPQYTGTGFQGYFYINYHLYRQVFPIMALGRFLRATAGEESPR